MFEETNLPRELRLLMIEDRAADAEIITRELRRAGYDGRWRRVETESDFLAELESPLDLILSDYSLPRFDGLRALKLTRERGLDTPFILISGTLGEEAAVEAMKCGATDYVLKDRMARLGFAVDRALRENQRHHEHQRAADALLSLQLQHELILNSAGEGILGVDTKGRIVFENPVAASLLGWDRRELIGQLAHETIHHEAPDGPACPRKNCPLRETLVDGGTRRSNQEVFRRKDGTCIPIECTTNPIRDRTGRILGAVLVFSDISERRQLEEQLRQAQKMEAIGQLAGGVAHDFNNILAAMMLQIELAGLSQGTQQEMSEALLELRSGAERAANLIRQLLLFSRRQVMVPSRLDLNQMVSSLSRMLRRIIGEDVTLELRLHPGPLVTVADPGMIDQVLMNLAVNARDAMPDGGQLCFETAPAVVDHAMASGRVERIPGRYLRLSICDTGCGISHEILPRIFEPFFTTKAPGKGTDLGLATVFGIVKQHEGWIEVESRPGHGTAFHVFLPVQEESAELHAKTSPNPLAGGTETILLVEDDVSLRVLTRITLERQGYQVLEAASGAPAQKVWNEHRDRIALLLTDVVMPDGMSGWKLAELLQADKPGLKVIYTSGYSPDTGSRGTRLTAGQEFVQKPAPPQALLAAVRRCLDQ